MADAKPTTVRMDDDTRIRLLTLLLEADASVQSAAVAVEVLANSRRLPGELHQIAQRAIAVVTDLDEQVRAFLKEGGTDA